MSSNYISATLAPQDRDDIMSAIAPFAPGSPHHQPGSQRQKIVPNMNEMSG
jgi:hypothetical protein